MIPFVRDFDPAYGRPVRLSPRLTRVTARNPGPFTFMGTNSFVVSGAGPGGSVAVVDPGPELEEHRDALLAAIDGRPVTAILLTHTHRDHVPLALPLAQSTGAPILGRPVAAPAAGAGFALDEGEAELRFDRVLRDADVVGGDGWTLRVVTTPGHASNHLCFLLEGEDALICGDHVMGWSTTVVAPPDGDMGAYMASLDRVIAAAPAVLHPAHGAPVHDPLPFLHAYRAHRLERERQVMARLVAGDRKAADMVPHLYATVDRRLWPAASLSIWAHLIDLTARGLTIADPAPTLDADYRPAA